MKKFIILSALLFALPSFATCPIDGGETVCSLPDFREQLPSVYDSKPSLAGDNVDSPGTSLRTPPNNDIENQFRSFAPAASDFNYNAPCQFGVCMQNRSTPLFYQPKQ